MGKDIDTLSYWQGTAFERKAAIEAKPLSVQDRAIREAQKEQLFTQLWNSPSGLVRVAFALSEPLKTRLDYVGIGRKLLMVDELPNGDVPFYDLDIDEFTAVKIAQRGSAPVYEPAVKRLTVPTFEVSINATIKKLELTLRKYPVFDRAKERVAISVAIEEDYLVYDLVKAAAVKGDNPSTVATYGSNSVAISKAEFASLYGTISERQLQVKTYLLGSKTYADMLKWQSTDLDPVSLNIMLESGQFGAIFGVRAIAATKLDKRYGYTSGGKNKQPVFALTSPDKLGRFPERKAIEIQIFDNVPELAYNIIAWEVIGMGIYNPNGVAALERAVS